MVRYATVSGVSFDLFGTLVTVERPDDPASTVARELRRWGIHPPDDWRTTYGEAHIRVDDHREVPLTDHVEAALRSRGQEAIDRASVRAAVNAAFDREITTRPGAARAVRAAAGRGPVAVTTNCSLQGLAQRTVNRADLPAVAVDTVVTSVGQGVRKPDPRLFEAVGEALSVPVSELLHVGDDAETDSGITACGGQYLDINETSLMAFARDVEGR